MNNRPDLLAQFQHDFQYLAFKTEAVAITMSPLHAWAALSAIQLASRHPGWRGPNRELAIDVARLIESKITCTKALKAVAQMGWDPQYDEEIEHKGG